jgi:STAS-like domain of unknown function (DUF4325)
MTEKLDLRIYAFLNSFHAESTEDGIRLYEYLQKSLDKSIQITINFINIDLVTIPFLNTAIGELFFFNDRKLIDKHCHVENLSQDNMEILKKVIEGAVAGKTNKFRYYTELSLSHFL